MVVIWTLWVRADRASQPNRPTGLSPTSFYWKSGLLRSEDTNVLRVQKSIGPAMP